MISEYTSEDGKKLLKLARESIEEGFSGKRPADLEEKQFKQARGVFVTLKKQGKLRGCIGFPYPVHSVRQAVYEAAKEAAFGDLRFHGLAQEELKDVKIEVSILTNPEQVKDVKDIKIGKHGLIGNYIAYSGLLLPQVATEHGMSRIEFLEALCDKMGMPKDTWQNKNFRISRFECQIFGED
jgi:AmmeMemoRadiSam system protein A